MRAWYDDIDTATLQRIKTYSAFNDPESKNLMVQTMYEYKQEEIAELEKACEETQKLLDKQIEATYKLDKENAELKKDKKELCHSISEGGKACVYLNEQLTKAKELLKQWLQTSKTSGCDNINIVTDTEQFLSEVKK